jgi:predicted alpha/beta hydrolase family esterase
MKKAIIFHGTDENPDRYWYSWLAQQLRDRGYEVGVPSYPDINHTHISEFLPKVLKAHTFDEETVLVGHSAGGPLLLSILENIDVTVPQAILIAGYSMRFEGEEGDPRLQGDFMRVYATMYPDGFRAMHDAYFSTDESKLTETDRQLRRPYSNDLAHPERVSENEYRQKGTDTFSYRTWEYRTVDRTRYKLLSIDLKSPELF